MLRRVDQHHLPHGAVTLGEWPLGNCRQVGFGEHVQAGRRTPREGALLLATRQQRQVVAAQQDANLVEERDLFSLLGGCAGQQFVDGDGVGDGIGRGLGGMGWGGRGGGAVAVGDLIGSG